MPEQDESPFSESVLQDLVNRQLGDQVTSSASALANIVASYYQALLGEGLPIEMAEELTLDYHWLVNASVFFKDGVFPSRGC